MVAGIEKPKSTSTLMCPLMQKQMKTVCHKCEFWEVIRGTNPNTGAEIDHWGCVLKHQFLIGMEQAKVTYEMGAALESHRNEMVEYARLQLRMGYKDDPEALEMINRQFKLMDAKNAAKLLNSHPTKQAIVHNRIPKHRPVEDI